MEDVTEIVSRYRLALRHIWNSYYYADPSLRTWDSVDSWRALKLPLFRALVADRLDLPPANEIFGKGFYVSPRMDPGGLPFLEVDTRVPSRPSAGTWEVLNGPFKDTEVRLALIDFFDWSPLDYSDLRYYVVQIETLEGHPDRVGQHALVEVGSVCVLWDAGAGSDCSCD